MRDIITTSDTTSWLQLPCLLDTEDLNALSSKLQYPVLIESQKGKNGSQPESRYTIFSAEPCEHFLAQFRSPEQNTNKLNEDFKSFSKSHHRQLIPLSYKGLPFVCGMLAFCSYRFGEACHRLEPRVETNFPDVFIGSYTWSYVFDHDQNSGLLTFSPHCQQELRKLILELINKEQTNTPNSFSNTAQLQWLKNQNYDTYKQSFDSVQNYILSGDCYQVNLAQRFECDLSQLKSDFSAFDYYLTKQRELQTPYSAFISFSQDCNLLSFSPEQFIRIQNRVIQSKPIKGTIANTLDQSNIDRLKNSSKNQAENLMIVDLLRNDLSKVCEVNSVHVPELFKIESFKNVHHMVSKICGRLRDEVSELDAFLSCFPGGSITGAPKLRAMEIIRELEQHDRSAYCGSIFYWNDNGHFDSNILIRSIIQTGTKLYCWAGGGIVADSEVMDEYQESLTKVANITGIKE